MLFAVWFSVDGCYALYWHFNNPAALAFMRDTNFPAYCKCGIVWLYRGSLHEIFSELRSVLKRHKEAPKDNGAD